LGKGILVSIVFIILGIFGLRKVENYKMAHDIFLLVIPFLTGKGRNV